MLRDTDWVNAKTGETGQAFMVIKGKKYPRGVVFMTMFAQGWRALAQWRDAEGRRLTATEWTVFAGLMGHLGFENVIPVSQAKLAKELGIAQPNISRAVKRLERAGFVACEKDENDPRRTIYRLSLDVGWMGDAPSWQHAIQGRGKAGRTRTADEDIDAFLAEQGFADGAGDTDPNDLKDYAGRNAAPPEDEGEPASPSAPCDEEEEGARRAAGVRV